MAREALAHFHKLRIDIAQALGDVDQAERDQDRDLDEDNAEVSGVEPDGCQDCPANRGK